MGKLRCIPTATESFDQQNAGFESPSRDFDVVAFVEERRGLPGNDLEVGVDAIFVTSIEEVERLLRRSGGVMLLAGFNLEVMQRIQVVLNLLKCGERVWR